MERNGTTLGVLEGRHVDVTLHDGRTIADCQLISGARWRMPTLWLVVDGDDVFVPTDAVVALAAARSRADDAAA